MLLARAVVVVAAGLTALAAGMAAADDGVVLRRALFSDPDSLDPAKSESVYASMIQDDLFEGLVTLDADDRPVPAAAESWQQSADGLTYSFSLRPGLLWSDGSPLTAQDFVYSFRRVVDPATASVYAFLLYPIANAQDITEGRIKDLGRLGVEAPDARTVKFHLVRPTPYFVAALAHAKFMPARRADVEAFGQSFTQPGHLVSNGAFTLAEWTPQSRIVLVKNPRFHDAAHVHIDKVIYQIIESQTEQVNRYRAGELDITDPVSGVPRNQLDAMRQRFGDELHVLPLFGLRYLGFNMKKPPFADNPKLRQALSMVIDRQAIVDKVLKSGEAVNYGMVPAVGAPGYAAQSPAWAALPMAERIARAKVLYQEAGYGPAHPLEVEFRLESEENWRRMAIAIAAMWQQALGVKTSLVNEDFKMLLQHRHEKQITQVFDDAWIGDYPDATTFLDMLLSQSGENDSGYSNAKYDALMAEAERTADLGRRAALLQQAEALMLDDNPVIPLLAESYLFLAKPYVQGFHPDPCIYIYSKDVTILPH